MQQTNVLLAVTTDAGIKKTKCYKGLHSPYDPRLRCTAAASTTTTFNWLNGQFHCNVYNSNAD